MSFAGKIEQSDLIEHIIPAYHNFDDRTYDIGAAKRVLKNFIVSYCKTQNHPSPSTNVDLYGMNICCENGLSMRPRNNKNILYIFCVKTGSVFVSEQTYMSPITGLNECVDFELFVMMHQDRGSDVYKYCKLLSPKS